VCLAMLCSFYMPVNSMPAQNRYFFKYNVKITNEGTKIVMLKSRHWVITNGAGRIDEVR
jgi:ApaG protein